MVHNCLPVVNSQIPKTWAGSIASVQAVVCRHADCESGNSARDSQEKLLARAIATSARVITTSECVIGTSECVIMTSERVIVTLDRVSVQFIGASAPTDPCLRT